MKKVTVFNGSPGGETSNTHFMVKEFLKGVEKGGGETENIFLVDKEIHHCNGNFSCWFDTPGKCIIDDDMTELLAKVAATDIIVFATPLYCSTVSGLLKNFMDRLFPITTPYIIEGEHGLFRHNIREEYSLKMVIIANSGNPGNSNFRPLSLLMNDVADRFGTELIGEVYRRGGSLFNKIPKALTPILFRYKRLLRRAGKELIICGRISPQTQWKLDWPVVSDEFYVKIANKYLEKRLAESGVSEKKRGDQ